MTLKITVPDDLEKEINRFAREAKKEPAEMALTVLKQGVSRRRALSTHATNKSDGKPKAARKPKAAAKPKAKKAKAGGAKKAKARAKVAKTLNGASEATAQA